MAAPRRFAVVTGDPVGERMGGMAIRAVALARVLSAHGDVVLAAPGGGPDGLSHVPWSLDRPEGLRDAVARADVIVAPPTGPVPHAILRGAPGRLVFDLYDPAPLEVLEAFRTASPLRRRAAATLASDSFAAALRDGHHFLCAGDRQRDLYTGYLLGLGLLTPAAYATDPTLNSRFSVVPFGIPDGPPPATTAAGPRQRFAALAREGDVVLWNGGIWNWLDPVTAVRAVARVDRARLVFMGRPPTAAPEAVEAERARTEARALGLLNTRVFFNDDWVPHDERGAWLAQAACTLSAHSEHLETRFSFRTRMLDSLWAGVPIVATAGDELADLVERDDLGAVAAPGDEAALATALERVLDRGRDAYAEPLAAAAERFRWPRVAAPLVDYALGDDTAPRLGRGSLARPGQRLRARVTRGVRAVVRHAAR